MTNPAELLANQNAPVPRAMLLETEVRTEGFFQLGLLVHPNWAKGVLPSSQLAEWRCVLKHREILELGGFLKEVLPSGKPRQQVINEALEALEIGSYLGTFAEHGASVEGGNAIRILFAYRFTKYADLKATNRAIYDLLTQPADANADASSSLKKLRAIWHGGTHQSECFLLMLTQATSEEAETHPFSAADR